MSILDGSAEFARGILLNRQAQDKLFGIPLRGTLAWDILLALFVADAEGRQPSFEDLVQSIGIRPESGKRWMLLLRQSGLIVCDEVLAFDTVATLTSHALTGLEHFIDQTRQAAKKLD